MNERSAPTGKEGRLPMRDHGNRNARLDAFTHSAAIYDALFDPAARLKREEPMLRRLLDTAPGERVLDLACGTGHHANFFAESGATVLGADLSDGMIAHAFALHDHARLEFRQADMRAPLPGPWDLVLCVGNSLSLLSSAADVDNTLQAVSRVLSDGGLFFVQILNYAHAQHQMASHKVFSKEMADGTKIAAVKNLVPQEGHTLLSLSFFAERTGVFESVAESAILRQVGLAELSAAADAAGIQVEAAYGSYDAVPFDPEQSPDLLMLFRKP